MKAHPVAGNILWLIRRATQLLRTEGVGGFAEGLGSYLRYRLVWNTRFVVMATDTSTYEVGLAMPPVEGLDVHVLHSEADVERLVGLGYQDVRGVVRRAGRRLRQGAVGFCAFVKGEVAHVAWVALNEPAKRTLAPIPCDVRFDEGEGYWGGSMTTRRFRNLGIYKYVMALRLRYCHECGYAVLVDATEVNNAASLKAQDIYAPRVRAIGRYSRILWWSNWKDLSELKSDCGVLK